MGRVTPNSAAIWATVNLLRPLSSTWSYICRASSACRGRSLGFGPPTRPRARAAARPSIVLSDMSACSNSAIDPRIWKNMRPTAVEVSMPWSRTTRSTPRRCRSLDSSMRCSRERPSRSSLVTTSWSPARLTECSALSSSGRRASLPAGFVEEHFVAAGGQQGVVLGLGVLVAGRDPSVADLHL